MNAARLLFRFLIIHCTSDIVHSTSDILQSTPNIVHSTSDIVQKNNLPQNQSVRFKLGLILQKHLFVYEKASYLCSPKQREEQKILEWQTG